ncbi:unnamed protein product [Orchesella dallaii]|uniref:Ig-like domain-containing protein n=1 Tax=Orchesella dallaii TaxID=48710 RepID=A0ABP1RBY2_9HEXA
MAKPHDTWLISTFGLVLFFRATESLSYAHQRPQISSKSSLIIVHEGESPTLECIARGFPEPLIHWERVEKRINPEDEKHIDGGIIAFHNVSWTSTGTYKCVAENYLGRATREIQLIVLHAPTINVEQNPVLFEIGEDARLLCVVESDPKATVVWRKDGNSLVSEDLEKYLEVVLFWREFYLKIGKVGRDDFGNYTCEATNSLGKAIKTISLIERETTEVPGYHENVGDSTEKDNIVRENQVPPIPSDSEDKNSDDILSEQVKLSQFTQISIECARGFAKFLQTILRN